MEESGLLNVLLFLSLVNTVLLLGFFSIAKGSISAITKMYKMWNEVKEESKKYGGGVSSISSVDVGYSGGGYTDSVKVVTNKGTFEFDGDTFKYVFNLRAPGAIHLKSGLFNVEKK